MGNYKDPNKKAPPGSGQTGDYYHVELRDGKQYKKFRYDDVGQEGGLQRLAGQKADKTWETQKWIIEKDMAYVKGDELIAVNRDAKELFKNEFETNPKRVNGDIFKTKPKKN